MEQFDLIRKSNYTYFKVNNQNVIIDFSNIMNCYSSTYKTLRIDSMLIEKSKITMDNLKNQLDIILNNFNLEDNPMFSGMLNMLKSSNLDMINNSMISNIMDNFKNQNLSSLQNKINEKLDLVLGIEGIKNFIILIDYKNMKVLFSRKKEEIGQIIGRTFRVFDTNNIFYNVLDNVFSYKNNKFKVKLDCEERDYITCSLNVFNILEKDLNEESKFIEVDGKKAYNFKFNIANKERDFFVLNANEELSIVDQLPMNIPNMPNMFSDMQKVDLSIPINLFSDAILIDGINNKFAYLKKDYVN